MRTATPTTYRGITFRSRLEADWAEYLDACGIRWEYESRRFGRAVSYLPDFRLNDSEVYLETKGTNGVINNNADYVIHAGGVLMIAFGYPQKVNHVKVWLPGVEVQTLRMRSFDDAWAKARSWLVPVG